MSGVEIRNIFGLKSAKFEISIEEENIYIVKRGCDYMIQSERYNCIVNIVNKKGFVSTKELSLNLNVTETTIRRDCEELESQGLLIRVHGGAKSINQKNILSTNDELDIKSIFYKV